MVDTSRCPEYGNTETEWGYGRAESEGVPPVHAAPPNPIPLTFQGRPVRRLGGVSTPCAYWSLAHVDRYDGDSGLSPTDPSCEPSTSHFYDQRSSSSRINRWPCCVSRTNRSTAGTDSCICARRSSASCSLAPEGTPESLHSPRNWHVLEAVSGSRSRRRPQGKVCP